VSTHIKILRQVLSKYSRPMTLNYPSGVDPRKKYSQIPEDLRGFIERDEEKCIGCRACYMVCSGRATRIIDTPEKRTVQVFHFRCTFCAHCEECCPEEAIKLSNKFELTVADRNDPKAYVNTDLKMLFCKSCGTSFLPEKMQKRAFERLSEKINPRVKEIVLGDYKKTEGYCPDCRRARGVMLDTHTKKHVWLEVV
jgi:formate hydrogenlyase subunit 6/NADH:ubiquinone oxidoreductase subunit I